MNIAIIPARGGSKRIPRKNIKEFHGKPMIAYSIEAAIESNCFDRIIVSTDDSEVAEVAKKFGAEVPFVRPESLADDYATTMDVIQHAIYWFKDNDFSVDNVCCLYATAPLLKSKFIQLGLKKLSESDCDFVFSATDFPFPIQRAIKVSAEEKVSMFNPENANVRSQDLEEAFHDAGQFYWGKASAYIEGKAIFSDRSRIVKLPRSRVQDIDTPDDWKFAELLYLALENQ